jgi:imidazolonepropionase-like amidohydrolase
MVAKTERIYEVHRASVGRAAAAGVKMAMGTDAGTPYNVHGDNLGEIELLVDAGLTAADAWRTATAGAAALLGLGDEIGTIEAGKRADLIAIAGDPFADVRGLPQRIKWVMQAGNVRRDARSGGRK